MKNEFIQAFYREQSQSRIHLNNAGLAPITKHARDKIVYWGERFYRDGFYCDADYASDVNASRLNMAKLIDCQSHEIAYFQSTASAVSQFAFEYPLNEGDEVIMWSCEYGSHLYPWQEACRRKKANLILVGPEKNLATPSYLLTQKITERTKVIAISWVQFLTGAMTNLVELSAITRKHNIFLFVDIIQGLGLHPFSMKNFGIDAVVGGSHKWLFGPVGVGYLALSSKYHALLAPHNVGAYTFGTCDDPTSLVCEPKKDALKFEAGSKQVIEITALGASVEFILKTTVLEIEKKTLDLADYLRNGLEKKGFEIYSPYDSKNHKTAMVNFKPKADTLDKLKSIPCNFALRGPGLRLSPAAFNTFDELDRVLSII